jgi:hypothetical protein
MHYVFECLWRECKLVLSCSKLSGCLSRSAQLINQCATKIINPHHLQRRVESCSLQSLRGFKMMRGKAPYIMLERLEDHEANYQLCWSHSVIFTGFKTPGFLDVRCTRRLLSFHIHWRDNYTIVGPECKMVGSCETLHTTVPSNYFVLMCSDHWDMKMRSQILQLWPNDSTVMSLGSRAKEDRLRSEW